MNLGRNETLKTGLILTALLAILIYGGSPLAAATARVQWSEDRIEIVVAAGVGSQQQIAITSNEDLENVNIEAVPSIADFVSINPSNIGILNSGQSQDVGITFNIPSKTKPGTYGGTIHVRSGSRTIPATLKIKITVTEYQEPQEYMSPANVVLDGACESCFNPTSTLIRFIIDGETLSINSQYIKVFQNERAISESLYTIYQNEVTCAPILEMGKNSITLYALDSNGLMIMEEYTFWAGNRTIQGTVSSEQGFPVDGATVTASLGDNQYVQETVVTDADGQFQFHNLPSRTIIFEATAGGNKHGSTAANGSDGYVQILMRDFNKPSDIPNNDISMGTQGWDFGNSPVSVMPHEETPSSVAVNSMINQSSGTIQQDENMDLRLSTSGEGPQTISRTFTTEPGIRRVTVRYQFITTEIPGGYYGTQFNDYFNISIRSQLGGDLISESRTMNGLGRAAFDNSGATAWMETSLRVEEGDTIQVDMTVANVADGYLDSFLVLDMIAESPILISELTLNDIDNNTLQCLSADSHTYFAGNTRIHGTITIEGPSDTMLESIELEVLQNGAVVAIADLDSAVESTLLETFGNDEKVEITNSQLLFNLTSAQAANVNGASNCTLGLRVRVTGQNCNEEVIEDSDSVELLVHFEGSVRYSGRDADQGGDDWAKPALDEIATHYGNTWGDFSNMNGGSFPPHASHQTGIDVDGWFNGYNARDANTAATIIEQLNDPTYGSDISLVYVTYQAIPTNAFWNAINQVVLNDGRRARDVILSARQHTTHFHWRTSE